MLSAWVAVCLAAYVAALPHSGKEILVPSFWSPRVINGDIADEGAWPSHISLQRLGPEGWRHTCGGILLDSVTVLTAAHCTAGAGPADRLVQTGVNNRDDTDNEVIVEISSIDEHPDYFPGLGYPNDVAILKLATAVEFTDRIQPAILPDEGEDFAGQECFITGWGRTDSSNNLPNELREGRIEVITNDACSAQMNNIIDSHICVQDPNAFQGACNGDSGGPIHCRVNENAPWKQVGVCSWGVNNVFNECMVTFPAVYGRISSHLQWIEERMG